MDKCVPVKFVRNHLCLYRLMVSAAFLMMLLPGDAIAQKEDKIKTILKASDSKKIEHAEEYQGYADNLMEKANQLSRRQVL